MLSRRIYRRDIKLSLPRISEALRLQIGLAARPPDRIADQHPLAPCANFVPPSLFQAPVESDISSKPALKNPADPATARSPIRRTDRRRVHEIRQHRLQLLHVLQGNDAAASDASSNERDRVPSAPRSRPAEVARPTARRSRYNHWADTAFGDEPVRESEERASSQSGQTERVGPPETSLPSIRGAEALFPDNATLFADTGLLRQVFDEYAEPARPWAASDSRSGSRERTAIRRSVSQFHPPQEFFRLARTDAD